MKSIRSLFMILIGMLGFTMTATTAAPLEQKQHATFEQPEMVYLVANVVYYEYVSLDACSFKSNVYVISHRKIYEKPLAIITDVGWRFSKQSTREIPYREKLLENYNLHFKEKLFILSDCSVKDNS